MKRCYRTSSRHCVACENCSFGRHGTFPRIANIRPTSSGVTQGTSRPAPRNQDSRLGASKFFRSSAHADTPQQTCPLNLHATNETIMLAPSAIPIPGTTSKLFDNLDFEAFQWDECRPNLVAGWEETGQLLVCTSVFPQPTRTGAATAWRRLSNPLCLRGAMIVTQHSTQAFATLNRRIRCDAGVERWRNDLVIQTLVIPFAVIMFQVLLYGTPQRVLTEKDHFAERLVLDRSHQPFEISIQVGRFVLAQCQFTCGAGQRNREPSRPDSAYH